MKKLIIILGIFIFTPALLAESMLPFASDFKNIIKNYNRLNATVATSGHLDDGALQELKEKGFKTIIDLRTTQEGILKEKKLANKLGISHFNIPISGKITDANLQAFIQAYNKKKGLTLIHCRSANRAGAMFTKYYLHLGYDYENAIEIGKTIGLKANLSSQFDNYQKLYVRSSDEKM